MRHAYLATVLDLSLPIGGERAAAAGLGAGILAALGQLEAAPRLRMEVALSGAVSQALLRWGEERPLQKLAERAVAGQVSFLSTACYGAFLPLVPWREAARQLELSERINREVLGEVVYRTEGLFPPQLGYSRSIAELALSRGATRVLADGLAWHGGAPLPRARHFTLRERPQMRVFFVDRRLSDEIALGIERLDHFRGWIARHLSRAPGYAVVRLPSRSLSKAALQYLAALASTEAVVPASLEDTLALFPEVEPVEPLPSALGTDPSELASGIQFAKWSAPGNELHALLWKLAQITAAEAARLEDEGDAGPSYAAMRAQLDESLDCAAWRFASGKPELDLARVQEGGWRLLQAVRAGGAEVDPSARTQAEQAYARLEQRCAEAAHERSGALPTH
jgi:hypothetical protein